MRLERRQLDKAERALFDGAEQFRELVERSLDLVGVIRSDGTIIYANSSLGRILGYRPESAVGGNAFDFIHPDDLERTRDSIRRAVGDPDHRFHVTCRVRHADGTYRHLETVGRGTERTGAKDRVLFSARDMTRRVELEETLRADAARAEIQAEASRRFAAAGLDYSRILEAISGALAAQIGDNWVVLLPSDDGEQLEVAALGHRDPEARRLALGLSREGWKLGDGAIHAVMRKGVPLRTAGFDTGLLSREAAAQLEPYRSRYGIFAVMAVPLRSGSRNTGVMILSRERPGRPYTEEDQALLQDLADRAATAIEMARLHGRVSEELAIRAERERDLEAANMELRSFAHNVSHDLKGPIATMKINLELLKEHGASLSEEDRRSMFESLLRNIDRSYNLVENLLALAEAGQFPTSLSDVDVSKVVSRVLEENDREIRRRGIEINAEEQLGVIRANPTHVYQVFSNLMLNAIRHNDNPSPRLSVTRLQHGERDSHRYRVRDNGPGVPPVIMDRLFEPFVKGETGGTGMGLAIVHRVLEVYGGHIRARNDGGACFEFVMKDYSG